MSSDLTEELPFGGFEVAKEEPFEYSLDSLSRDFFGFSGELAQKEKPRGERRWLDRFFLIPTWGFWVPGIFDP